MSWLHVCNGCVVVTYICVYIPPMTQHSIKVSFPRVLRPCEISGVPGDGGDAAVELVVHLPEPGGTRDDVLLRI